MKKKITIPRGVVLIPESAWWDLNVLLKHFISKSILQYRWVFIPHILAQTTIRLRIWNDYMFLISHNLCLFDSVLNHLLLSRLGNLLSVWPFPIFRRLGCDNVNIVQLTEKHIFHVLFLKVCISACHHQLYDMNYMILQNIHHSEYPSVGAVRPQTCSTT